MRSSRHLPAALGALLGTAMVTVCATHVDIAEPFLCPEEQCPPITPEIKASMERSYLEDIAENGACIVATGETTCDDPYRLSIEYGGTPRAFAAYLTRFMNEALSAQGLPATDFSTWNIYISTHDDVQRLCDGSVEACANSNHRQIVVADSLDIGRFMQLALGHEAGHVRSGTAEEFPAEAHETYMPLKAYEFLKPVGSLLVTQALDIPGRIPPHHQSKNSKMYADGLLYALILLDAHRGNVEQALDSVSSTTTLAIQTRMLRKWDEMAQTRPALFRRSHNSDGLECIDPTDCYVALWDELFDSGFYYSYLVSNQNLTAHEAAEFIDFMRFQVLATNWLNMSDIPAAWERLRSAAETFQQSGYPNPYFTARVTDYLLPVFAAEMNGLWTPENHTTFVAARTRPRVRELSLRILEMMQRYPCAEKNPYTCALPFRTPRIEHLDAFDRAIWSQYYQWRQNWQTGLTTSTPPEHMERMLNLVDDFITRFYPGTDVAGAVAGQGYDSTPLQPIINGVQNVDNYVPVITWPAVDYLSTIGVLEAARRYIGPAINATCAPNAVGSISAEECESYKQRHYERLTLLNSYNTSNWELRAGD